MPEQSGPKTGACSVPFRNTMSPEPRPTSVPSGILIHPAVWPQCTDVTDRRYVTLICAQPFGQSARMLQTGQTDKQHRQRTDSIGRTVLQTVAQKRGTFSSSSRRRAKYEPHLYTRQDQRKPVSFLPPPCWNREIFCYFRRDGLPNF